ncbi:hypothetical protein mRhiFer1_009439 [Rhinolophus ferrumequinum]|uniref:Uncharacterized protein n=1 Tax=Rhinolophus ferrumequinum TaxID=59479 RepID=A0A7J7RJD0_RHIFE|nr:hypothetical protein mRhiFer1_009439 [Rhinolophus ferrumequinum]
MTDSRTGPAPRETGRAAEELPLETWRPSQEPALAGRSPGQVWIKDQNTRSGFMYPLIWIRAPAAARRTPWLSFLFQTFPLKHSLALLLHTYARRRDCIDSRPGKAVPEVKTEEEEWGGVTSCALPPRPHPAGQVQTPGLLSSLILVPNWREMPLPVPWARRSLFKIGDT